MENIAIGMHFFRNKVLCTIFSLKKYDESYIPCIKALENSTVIIKKIYGPVDSRKFQFPDKINASRE